MKNIIKKLVGLFTSSITNEEVPLNELLKPTLMVGDTLVSTKEELIAALKAMLKKSRYFSQWSREYRGYYQSLNILNANGCYKSYVITDDMYWMLREKGALKCGLENDYDTAFAINKLTRTEKIDNLLENN